LQIFAQGIGKYFGENLPNLSIHIGDGRWNLEQSPHLYDIIAVDAYRPPYIPPHMTTREFYQICAAHLTETGVVAINVGSAMYHLPLLTLVKKQR
jgi:spermidine synthase